MTEEITNTETETETTPPAEEEVAAEDFTDADRQKLTEVVRKERAAAKAAKASAEQAETRLAELEANELRRSVAEEKGMSAEQAAFLSGGNAEEMAASADALLAAFGDGRDRQDLRRRPVEKTRRTGVTAVTEGIDNMAAVADRVLD